MDVTAELTIVIPVRIDCKERKENLDIVLFSILETTSAFIIILEADSKRQYFFKEREDRIKYVFIHDDNPILHRTHYLNKLLKMSETDKVGIWDTDVILNAKQIKDGINAINNGITLCYPYDGRFLFLGAKQSNQVRYNMTSFLNLTDENTTDVPTALGRPSVGGAFIVNKDRYLQAGGENENFYGWGPEDAERLKRMEILQEPIARIKGPLFHLYHPRGINSACGYTERDKNNVNELIKVCSMKTAEMHDYIDTWTWKS
ncbi:N-terminal domain of galactosyltransferase [Saccharicrinis carchari]|uniref:N-terminal domain of galactosyltransferase n=1 Tax=Saccharicrinis carchari TaxID=1168039 RepID=A0A521DGH4_SACCC|nr:galactosyltransferase-related protein [Saccharicrinis carchari]SMO70819.1 N-terminal domain of galactosyltransferase [Saccharicrinis carchari]